MKQNLVIIIKINLEMQRKKYVVEDEENNLFPLFAPIWMFVFFLYFFQKPAWQNSKWDASF